MGVLRLAGSLNAGPPSATSEAFPASSFAAPLLFLESTKGFSVASGVLKRNIASALSFVPLQGAGPTDAVTKATFLYLKSSAVIELRLTTDDGAGGDVVAIIPPGGLFLLELDATKFLKLLEARGTASVEYFVSGNE